MKAENKKPFTRASFESLVIDRDTGSINNSQLVVNYSIYDVHLTRWLHYFSLNQFYFISAENLVANPVEELQKIEKFLGVRHKLTKDVFYFNKTRGFYCMCVNQRKLYTDSGRRVTFEQTCLPRGKGRNHPSIDLNVLKKLRIFFRPHNKRLYKMVGINFGWK